MYFQDQHHLQIQNYDHRHSGGLTMNHSHTQLQHYFLNLKPLQTVFLCEILLPHTLLLHTKYCTVIPRLTSDPADEFFG